MIEYANAHRRWTTCRYRISDYRAGWGLLGLAPSLTFTCALAPAISQYSPQPAAPRCRELTLCG